MELERTRAVEALHIPVSKEDFSRIKEKHYVHLNLHEMRTQIAFSLRLVADEGREKPNLAGEYVGQTRQTDLTKMMLCLNLQPGG